MKKWLFLTAVAAVLVATGITTKAFRMIEDRFNLRSLETQIRDNIVDLKARRGEVFGKVAEIESKAAGEKASMERDREEREKLDQACRRLAARLNDAALIPLATVSEAGISVAGSGTPTSLVSAVSRTQTISWGAHNLSREQATKLVADWGGTVDELDKRIQASAKKFESYQKAVQALEKDTGLFAQSITDLESKLKELLTAREVLQVQKQVAEILAAVSGRNVAGETAELMTKLQTENDTLRGQIAAYGFTGTTDSLVRPDDDLRTSTQSHILARYGLVETPPSPQGTH